MHTVKFLTVVTGLLCCQLLFAAQFNTGKIIIESGTDEALAADEGYLLISLDVVKEFNRMSFKANGSPGQKIGFKNIKAGRNMALVKLKAGQYHLNVLKDKNIHRYVYEYLDEGDFSFAVQPGVVNYPGTWLIDITPINRYRHRFVVTIQNQLSYIHPFFQTHYAALVKLLPLVYSGQVNDRYISHLSGMRAERFEKDQPEMYFDPLNDAHPRVRLITDTADTSAIEQRHPLLRKYLSSTDQLNGGVNRSGRFLLFGTVINEQSIIAVADTRGFQVQVVYQQQLPEGSALSALQWVDEDTIHYAITHRQQRENHVAHITHDDQLKLTAVSHLRIPARGEVIAVLKKQDNAVYFATAQNGAGRYSGRLYQLNIKDKKSLRKSFRRPFKLTKKLENVVDYVFDGDDQIRAATSVTYDQDNEQYVFHYWFLADVEQKKWRKIGRILEEDNPFFLSRLSADESYFYVITDRYTDKSAIHKYATEDLSHQGVLHEDQDFAIRELLFDDDTDQLVGYRYVREGLYRVKYFNQQDHRVKALEASMPGMNLFVHQTISQAQQLLIYGIGPANKGAWFIFDEEKQKLTRMFDVDPEYEALPKGQYRFIKAVSGDGFDLEGYLVTPKQQSGVTYPLVVIPHGGPVGVRDFAYNDSVQHFLAAQGVATLKVNFRGSAGFGKQFEQAGNRQWGEKIEQDIHDVVLKTIATAPIDKDRICAMGGSYGGYSAVMLTVLYPEYYQCAVSWAGIMDLPLLLSNAMPEQDQQGRERLKQMVGDPATELEQLINKSPVYLTKRLTKPMLLIHGLKDNRVGHEHTMRMVQTGFLAGLDVNAVMLVNEGHAFTGNDARTQLLALSTDFLLNTLDNK
ncbi:alpha/beta hydrolase family protein [Marinicella sediminis]|uniref:Alpha/beta hydrolase family protein n=1 Tax=Marinicella sediminis TaxID=1792834 RepID=A0ABV7JA00_9GAMM|nr:prolyl oligopeptidase family serine peptidase [Marinicella sediminis]